MITGTRVLCGAVAIGGSVGLWQIWGFWGLWSEGGVFSGPIPHSLAGSPRVPMFSPCLAADLCVGYHCCPFMDVGSEG